MKWLLSLWIRLFPVARVIHKWRPACREALGRWCGIHDHFEPLTPDQFYAYFGERRGMRAVDVVRPPR